MDRNFFIKAKIDPMFDSIRPQIDALLEDIFQETNTRDEKEISNAEFDAQRINKWFSSGYASQDDVGKYELICNSISNAKTKLNMHSYFGCDDALRIMSDSKNLLSDVQLSLRNNASSLENRLTTAKVEFHDIPNKIGKIRKKKSKGRMEGLLIMAGGILVSLLLIAGLSSENVGIGWKILILLIILLSWYLIIVAIGGGLIQFLMPDDSGYDSNSAIKNLKERKKELTKQIGTLEQQIAVAKESMIEKQTI
ncbi:MAG: hypothetical protein U9R02_06680 [Thermodesulfobacteriota bacterium]|nr:hypothetical protein [Thermodesulfobacteriota bacterium]